MSLSDAAAESLSKNKGGLHLESLESLSDVAAESFGKHKGELRPRRPGESVGRSGGEPR